MSRYTKEDIFRIVEEEDVEFIRLQFTDIFGMIKNVAVTVSQLERALNNQCMFDGSAIEGFVRIEESDMYLYPDLDTFEIFPWRPQQGKVARFICDVHYPGGEPFDGDPRYVLKKVMKKAKDMGYTFLAGPECEFFLFHTDEEGNPTTVTHEKAGYFDVGPLDFVENVRRDIVLCLEDMGFDVEASHHELAPAQHEVDLQYQEGLRTADDVTTFKMTVKNVAKRHGLHATFMPKPQEGVNGSGMHINMSLTDGMGRNLFEDKDDPAGLSTLAYQFMAGILYHMKEMVLLTNPLVNSYKRLIPGYDAPNYIAWSIHSNRSALIRIPSARGYNTRVELRCPDSSANPYLALAACLAAGLDGIEKQMTPPPSVNRNIYAMSREEKEAAGIEALPETLKEAMNFFEASDFMKEVLGEHIFTKYLEAKEREWKAFRAHVTDWEVGEYLYKY
ncbi:type I glutamate--ammonia ligase [Lachnoclostridium sp. An14]|uniref:type I glutamate--ammonia ligase n=1 Tax=Lachnoclostridium sp. An14 TaxID=1965562 RepID=UPI000B38904B|nr:type I glutamate--ammonia ligase [Lachnoclostridium sp. An14]OUQ13960.1 type I glutamate--ammonia ligase [Lachnoclostridium sp. An14]